MTRATIARWTLIAGILFALSVPTRSSQAGSLAIDSEGKTTLESWEGDIQVFAASPRALWLSLTPKDLSPGEIAFKAEGLQPGEYYLSVSGAEPQLLTAESLAEGRTLQLPAVVGAAAADLLDLVKAWEARLDRVVQVVKDHGRSEEEIPSEYREAMQTIRDAGDGLEEASLWRAVTIRVTPKDAGQVPLASPSAIDSESLVARREALVAAKTKLIKGAGSLQGSLRKDLLEALLPIRVDQLSGKAISLALRGEGGEGNVAFNITHPFGGDRVEIIATLPVPAGWTIDGATSEAFTLEPGETRQVTRQVAVLAQAKGTRIGFPIELSVRCEGIRYQTVAGLGFGHDFIRDWSVIGPFENLHNSAVDRQDPPEVAFDPQGQYEVLGGTAAGWKPATVGENGYLDLKEAFDPNTHCAAFASVFVYSPEDRYVQCAAGSNDGMKVLMNGTEVFRFPGERGAQPEQDLFPAHLSQGWNHLLVESFNAGGEWGIYFEIRDKTGGAVEGIRFSVQPQE